MANLEEYEKFIKKHFLPMVFTAFVIAPIIWGTSEHIRVNPKKEEINSLKAEIDKLHEELKTNKEKENKHKEELDSYKKGLKEIQYKDLRKDLEESKKSKKILEKISNRECDHWGLEDKNGKMQIKYDRKCLKEKENAKNELKTINEEIKQLEKDIKSITEN